MSRLSDTIMARRWRELGLDVKTIAKAVGVAPSYVYQVAHGEKTPSLQTAVKFCRALQMPMSELFPGIAHLIHEAEETEPRAS